MSLQTLIALAIALAMDAFAVAISTGVLLKTVRKRQLFRLSWHFGLFQTLMPVLGWCGGVTIRHRIEALDHWVAFLLLAYVGGKMILDALGTTTEEEKKTVKDPTKGTRLIMLSTATSIDALAVGFSMSVLNMAIILPAIIIGIVAGGFTIVGFYLGALIGNAVKLDRIAGVLGGSVLIGIGLRILNAHGVF